MTYTIEVENLTKKFNGVIAVNHISFKVKRGEIFGFLGPNGAGKTTTIRILTGILKPDEGKAIVAGYNVLEEPVKVKQRIGVVPEVSNAYVDLTAWENLMLIGELNGIPKEERTARAIKLLKELELYKVRNRLVRGFSKGMRQRLLLCMALINDPDILFLDEPTSGLDVESARKVREMIQQYGREGKTVFLSTHNMEEANQLCHRIAIINHGVIAAIDTPERLRMKYSELQYIEVLFNKPIKVAELSTNSYVAKIMYSGNKIRLYTNTPSKVIEFIVDFSRKNNLEVLSLNTMMPSLEEVYMKLIKGQEDMEK
ncbi:MAG: ATP-binding cassette domain-containing protein [archaeon GB-1867-005]|nr:ATP-binding cassette domain-containing protein [Candidatus Culexmicrobium cathedralense]